ncbi:hypothetical protein [Marivirga harenae]|uniref:hypothetical protein n=1 Tax=Marivirga harenae TaxID=2010992 RepID=UPI0026E07B24|nr:hypothetical protein [Marivirga harenae]WKV10999.1 hypothetical protein Q3Y49_12325 [Marivirga harenae]|tara:strand:- start:70260 stop:71231 length:972 start_codon:yes stop_codon:yes gene_type:complete
MKTILSLIILALIICNNFPSNAQTVNNGNLFFCRANADMGNIIPIDDKVIIRPNKASSLLLSNRNGLIDDTLKMKKEWGPVMGVVVTSDSTFSVALGAHGLGVQIKNNKFSMLEEIPSVFFIEEYETGMKIPIADYVVGITPNTNAPRKHSIYQFALIHKVDSQLLILNEPLPLKARYYQGMSHLADYYVSDNKLIINHSEANALIIHDLKNEQTEIKRFPEIEDKNKEIWYAIVDNANDGFYLVRNRKKEVNEVYSYNLKSNELQFILSTEHHISSINKSRAFYREKDEEGDICFYYIGLDQTSNSSVEVIKLDEVTIENNN